MVANSVPSLQSTELEGSLYFSQVHPDTIALLQEKIVSLNPQKAIHWNDRQMHRTTFEFGISFKEAETTGKIVRYDMPDFLRKTRRELVELFQIHLEEKDPEKYENCILTLYHSGEGIRPHKDRSWFGPDILLLVIEPDCSSDPDKPCATLCFEELLPQGKEILPQSGFLEIYRRLTRP